MHHGQYFATTKRHVIKLQVLQTKRKVTLTILLSQQNTRYVFDRCNPLALSSPSVKPLACDTRYVLVDLQDATCSPHKPFLIAQELVKACQILNGMELSVQHSRKMNRKRYHNTCDMNMFIHELGKKKTLFSCLLVCLNNLNSLSMCLGRNFQPQCS